MPPMKYVSRPEGLVQIGHNDKGFAFDNESPRHRVFLHRHAMASQPVTNGEYLEFIHAGGYTTPELWLSDGWATVQREGWSRPLYWSRDLTAEFTLGGMRELDTSAPVCHVSYYEADAFARWAGVRLPTEAEWETLAAEYPIKGNFMDSGLFHPRAVHADGNQPQQLFGDVWEWTTSAYATYPGYRRNQGSARRIQRQVYVQSAGAARRFLRHTGLAYACELPQFFLPTAALAVHGRAPRQG